MVVQRVQALAEAGLSYLPTQYIQPPELRPDSHRRMEAASAVESGSIPVLDLDPSMNPLPHLRRLCSEWGAFQVVNHGVPSRLLEEMKEAGLRFFRSPTEAKLRYACDPGSAATEGYGSRMLSKEEGVLDWRDYFDHHTLPESRRNPSRWPDFPENYRDVILEYSDKMKALARRLLSMISESLNLPHSYIEDAIGESYQNITISYYSPCPQPELALGLQSHSDMGAITLLIQDDVGGLEVLKDGDWVLAKPLSDAIIVVLADQTERAYLFNYNPSINLRSVWGRLPPRRRILRPTTPTCNWRDQVPAQNRVAPSPSCRARSHRLLCLGSAPLTRPQTRP